MDAPTYKLLAITNGEHVAVTVWAGHTVGARGRVGVLRLAVDEWADFRDGMRLWLGDRLEIEEGAVGDGFAEIQDPDEDPSVIALADQQRAEAVERIRGGDNFMLLLDSGAEEMTHIGVYDPSAARDSSESEEFFVASCLSVMIDRARQMQIIE